MPTPVTINTAAVQYVSGTTECYCALTAETITGPIAVNKMVVLPAGALPPDWTDAQLCAAVAAALEVPASDVSVAGGFDAAAAAKATAAAPTDAEGAE